MFKIFCASGNASMACIVGFHRVHHTAETMTPLTVYRTPCRGGDFSLGRFCSGTCGERVSLFLHPCRACHCARGKHILFVFNALGSNLRHSHIWISYGSIFERFLFRLPNIKFITPPHQSSRSEFGAVLAIWDWLGGSLTLAPKNQSVRFMLQAQARQSIALGGYI